MLETCYVVHGLISPQTGCTALYCAGANGHLEIVKLLLQAGAKVLPNNVNIFPDVELDIHVCMYIPYQTNNIGNSLHRMYKEL